MSKVSKAKRIKKVTKVNLPRINFNSDDKKVIMKTGDIKIGKNHQKDHLYCSFLFGSIFLSKSHRKAVKSYILLVNEPTIIFFGERDKILYYDIDNNEWNMLRIDSNEQVEFHYFS